MRWGEGDKGMSNRSIGKVPVRRFFLFFSTILALIQDSILSPEFPSRARSAGHGEQQEEELIFEDSEVLGRSTCRQHYSSRTDSSFSSMRMSISPDIFIL